MTKFKKGLAFAFSAMISANTAGIISADALWHQTTEVPLTAPAGYTDFSVNTEFGSVRYQNEASSLNLLVYYEFNYNITHITLADGADSAAVYEKYMSDIEFDHVSTVNGINAYDEYESGSDPRLYVDKYKAILNACAEMYADGILAGAEYNAVQAVRASERIRPSIRCVDFTGTDEELLGIAGKYADYYEVADYYDGTYVTITNLPADAPVYASDTITYADVKAVCDEIDALYDGDTVGYMSERNAGEMTYESESINLLTAIQEETACDVDNSGTADLDDAVLVLNRYAQLGAGVAAADAGADKMDVDGDGEVTLDDAAFVVTVYAETAAGMR